MHKTLIYLMAFLMGAFVMVIELLGSKILAPFAGSDIYTWGSLLFVFMMGLAFGYALGGKASTYNPSLNRFGLIFLIAGLLILPLTIASNSILEAVFALSDDVRIGALLSSTVLFFIPAMLMGMASPYAIRLLVDSQEQCGNVAGRLYFTSTVGSGIGTLATSFYLVTILNVNQIMIISAGLIAALGMLAMAVIEKQEPENV